MHSQDITLPLGRPLPLDPAAAAEAASRAWSIRYFKAGQRMRGFRLVATDFDWTVGEGQPVQAPIDVLLVFAGRLAVLPRLEGAGAAGLVRQHAGG